MQSAIRLGKCFLCICNTHYSNEMKVSVENREFTIIVEEEPEGRGFSGQCKELPNAISQGNCLRTYPTDPSISIFTSLFNSTAYSIGNSFVKGSINPPTIIDSASDSEKPLLIR